MRHMAYLSPLRIGLLIFLLAMAFIPGCGDGETTTVNDLPSASPLPIVSPSPSALPSGVPVGSPSPGTSPGSTPTPTPVPQPGTVTVNFVVETLQRVVPAFVQSYRARGVDAQARTVYGPFERPRTSQLVLADVPLNVVEIQIDLVIGTTVTGLVRLPVDLRVNRSPVFNCRR